MPIGAQKNALYGLMLPLLGKRCEWRNAAGANAQTAAALTRILRKRHVVGACVQRFEKGALTECYTAGFATLEGDKRAVSASTVFRTASIAKLANALLVFRLQTLGKLSIFEDVSDLLGYPVRNPHYPDAPITLSMLLSHTSSIVDPPAYYAALAEPRDLSELLKEPAAYVDAIPGIHFRYSNLAAGLVGCILEKRMDESYERLAQRELFDPLGVKATFDLTAPQAIGLASSYRVLPPATAFDAEARKKAAKPLDAPDPERHYTLASGGLYLSAPELCKLALVAWNGHDGFLNDESLSQLKTPVTQWPQEAVRMRHGMGLLQVDDPAISPMPLWGHQGFAYGAVNGVFFDAEGNGFASLNSGASEQRVGHLSVLNRDLIALWRSPHE